MMHDEALKGYHERVTRGETLTFEEQAQLEAWYAAQDRAEEKALGLAAKPSSLEALQTQVDTALAQLTIVSRRINEIASENDALRRDINALRQQLADQLMAHAV